MKKPVYLDYAATTPVDQRVAEKMAECLTLEGRFGNPASRSHRYGWQAEEAVEHGRRQVASLINADPREIVWTSGATEADNLAIKGVAEAKGGESKNHIITSRIEHKAVLDTCRYLEGKGFEITWLSPGTNGLITPRQVADCLRDDTLLISVMHVNNEIGVINDIAAIGEVACNAGVLFHVDAAQSAGKIPIDVQRMKVDLMSFSAHKVYGPKGIGALFVRRSPLVSLVSQMHGGGHERGMRSGTLPTHQIAGMGQAFEIAREELAEESRRILWLRQKLWQGLRDLEAVYLNGDEVARVPGNLNVSFGFVDGETLLMALGDIALSSGSACTSATVEPSYVLKALGVEDDLAHATLRLSIGRYTTEEEIDFSIDRIRTVVRQLRSRNPLWQKRDSPQ